jgi:hypothetical protein
LHFSWFSQQRAGEIPLVLVDWSGRTVSVQLSVTYYCSEIISSLHYIRNYQLCFTDWTNILPGTCRGAGLKSKKENPSSGQPHIKMAGKMCLPAVGTIKTNASMLCFS